jgi:hypothetical protein
MINGWFVGNFEPAILKSKDIEVAVKYYKKGDKELAHFHKIATEITVIVKGKVKMNGVLYKAGDIVLIEPFETTDFEALEDTITTVVKSPGAHYDKYYGKQYD